MQLCTIVARNYLAQARVLAGSFLRAHPGSSVSVLLVDGSRDDGLTDRDPFETLSPEDLGIDPIVLRQMRVVYDVTELSTALKPNLLRHLLARSSEPVVYIDPDCEIHEPLNEIDGLAREHSIVLTPHVLSPLPRDGLLIDEQLIMWSGIFNLGFIAVSRDASPLLDWWQERTRFDAIKDPQHGLFTDQRWLDWAPALFRHHVLRDPGYNVAYWNLFERPVQRRPDGSLTAGGAPLRFFHFSGYDADHPHLLSVHQGDRPRARLADHPVVADLCEAYARSLRAADFNRLKQLPYRYDRIDAGQLPVFVRRLVRAALLDPAEAGNPPPDPFGDDGGRAFVDWLNEPVISSRGAVVTRLLLAVWRERADLQGAFPDVEATDASKLARWARHDPGFLELVGHLHRASDQGASVVPLRTKPSPGLNIVGYFDAELGVGEAGRLMIRATEEAGIPVATLVYRHTLSRQHARFDLPGRSGSVYDIDLLCVNADSTPRLVARLDSEGSPARRRIGLWFWEVEEFPRAMHNAFDHVDEVWVASEFTRESIHQHTKKPVSVFPLPILPDPPSYLRRADLGIPDGLFFLFAYDALSVPARKNPIAVVDAFKRAFPAEGSAFLLVKAINGSSHGAETERVRRAIGSRSDVRLVDAYWPRQWMRAVTQLCDCYVSLHRSEGFGLTLAHAMAHAKPVIATGYSGNMAYMDEHNSLLVPYELVPIGPGHQPYPAGARWAEPDVDTAAELMRRVHEDPAWAAGIGRRGRESVARTHGLDRSADALRRHFDRMEIAVVDDRLAQ